MEIKTTKDLAGYLTEKMKGMERGYKLMWDLEDCLKELDPLYHSFLNRSTVDISYAGFLVCTLTLKCKREAKKGWLSHVQYTFFVDSFTPAKGEEDVVIADVIEKAKAHKQKREQAEQDKAASFLEQLAEHGFKDIEELARILYNASKEQKLFLRSRMY